MFDWESVGNKLKNATGMRFAVFSQKGRLLFSNFDVFDELLEAVRIAIQTKVKVSMRFGKERVLVLPKRVIGSWKILSFVGYEVSEESLINLLVELLECFTEQRDNELKLERVLLETLKVFFENDLSLTKTSEIMGVHKNTVLYRLNKVKENTGLDPRRFNDAMKLRELLEKSFE